MKTLALFISIIFSINTLILFFKKTFTIGSFIMLFLSVCFIILFTKWEFFVNISKNGIYFYLKVCIIVFMCLYSLITSYILLHANTTTNYNEDVLIVLGSGVNDDNTPTDTAILRLNEAIKYYQNNPDCYIILTGSTVRNSKLSEAEVMKEYLIDNNIPSRVILTDTLAQNTYQNFTNSKIILEDNNIDYDSVVIITQGYHLYRATHMAKLNGFNNVNTISAKTDLLIIIPSFIRETAAVIVQVFIGVGINI